MLSLANLGPSLRAQTAPVVSTTIVYLLNYKALVNPVLGLVRSKPQRPKGTGLTRVQCTHIHVDLNMHAYCNKMTPDSQRRTALVVYR
jgi:hypothetical protein